jgi:GH25 family lysozyme M1 (1,4-beta-N-acetylmuramidase)
MARWTSIAALLLGLLTQPCLAADNQPWRNPETAVVIDAYELNIIEWDKLITNPRVAGFISKASDGLPEVFDCARKFKGDAVAQCKTMWRKYAVSRELYQTRRMLAKASGLLWGAYHLARAGNPIDQANHFLDYAKPAPDELMVLDLEGLDGQFMSPEDAEIFAIHIKERTGRYPILYTNNITARYIAEHRDELKLLSRLPLWYARYKPDTGSAFPMGNWDNYFLWQFSSASNCNNKTCPMRIDGTLNDIDVNTSPYSRQMLRAHWAQGELLPEKPPIYQYLVSASGEIGTSRLPDLDMMTTSSIQKPWAVETALNYQDFSLSGH